MKYTEEEFLRLFVAIESDGGRHVKEKHQPRYDREVLHEIRYCGKNAQFEIPYMGPMAIPGEDVSYVQVCAEDDMLGLWPRFKDANAKGIA